MNVFILAVSLAALSATAQVPGLISHQGKVTVSGTNYTGTGLFKFALVNAAGDTTYWSNDGTSSSGSQPTAAVSLAVARGVFSVNLGDTTVANMTQTIPAGVFTNSVVYLRVWFNDGPDGSQLLTPDRRITSVGYALAAASLTGPVSLAQLPAAVLTNGASGVNLSGTFTGNGGGLTDLTIPTASGSQAGLLAAADWNTFNNKTPTTRTVSTTAPLTGGGDLSANRTIALPQATASVDGYLSHTDWNTFNNKGGGTGTIGGSGTVNYVPMFTGGTTLGSSAIYQSPGAGNPVCITGGNDFMINTTTELYAAAPSRLNILFDGSTSLAITMKTTSAAATPLLFLNSSGANVGSVGTTASATAYNTSSDRRLKENITPTHLGLADLMQVQAVDYNFIADASKAVQTGFIAQDLNTVFPAAVTVGGDDANTKPWAVDYGRLTPLLVKSIQDLKAENDTLKAQNADILQRLAALEAKLGK